MENRKGKTPPLQTPKDGPPKGVLLSLCAATRPPVRYKRIWYPKGRMRRRRGTRSVEYLFSDCDLYSVLEGQRMNMTHAIDDAEASVVNNRPAEEIASEFVREFEVRPPELTEGAISVEVEEAQVDVSGDPNRLLFDHEGPFYVAGIRARYYVPFRGDSDLLKCRPSTYSTMLPAVEEIGGQEVVISYERGDTNVAATKQEFDRDLSHIKQYLEWVRSDCQTFNASLPVLALQRVAARQVRLREMRQGADSLGVPIRRQTSQVSAGPSQWSWRDTGGLGSALQGHSRAP